MHNSSNFILRARGDRRLSEIVVTFQKALIEILRMKITRPLLLVFALAGMVPPIVFRLIRWYSEGVPGPWSEFFFSLMTSVITTLTISIVVVKIMIWLHENCPWKNGVIKRLFLEIVLTTSAAITLIVLLTLITHVLRPYSDLRLSIFNFIVVALIMNFVLVAITEGVFFFSQWKTSAVQAERYKKESIRAQFESLKNQVNPHFLFNSLNTLSALIDYDQEMSKEFVDNLSSVYRYVLQHKDEELVSVSSELDFVTTYIALLKKRHGDKLTFDVQVDPSCYNGQIPPLTLQILVENAVKHNVASRKKPLHIDILSRVDMIYVENKIQPKLNVDSTGVGLKNIKSRYDFLTDRSLTIQNESEMFQVGIPILNLFTASP